MEENAESKEGQIKKLEATVKSLSEELIKVCEATCRLPLCYSTRIHIEPDRYYWPILGIFQNIGIGI